MGLPTVGSNTVWVFLGGLIFGAVLAYFLSFNVNVRFPPGVIPHETTQATSTPAITSTSSMPLYTSSTVGAYQ